MRWRCEDIGTALYQGYASALERVELERVCGAQESSLPLTGASLVAWLIVALALVASGLLLKRSAR